MTNAALNLNNLNILWYSNAPWIPSGYGQQTGMVTRALASMGAKVSILSNFGLSGAALDIGGGIKVYPKSKEMRSNDVVQAVADEVKADLIISLYDTFNLNFSKQEGYHTPWLAWLPIDTEEVSVHVLESIEKAFGIIAISKHGQAALKRKGVDAYYIPHGVDTNIFKPRDRNKARESLKLPIDKFIIGMVAANSSPNDRKNFSSVLTAFKWFLVEHPESILFLHTHGFLEGGLDIRAMATAHGISENVYIADPYQMYLGYPANKMADIYNSFDVFLNPAKGEGFGIPIIEAMACGTPLAVTDGTAMTELVEDVGTLFEGEPYLAPIGEFQTHVSAKEIFTYLMVAKESVMGLSANLRERGEQYDFETKIKPMWFELLANNLKDVI